MKKESGRINDILLGLEIFSPSMTTILVGLLPNGNNGQSVKSGNLNYRLRGLENKVFRIIGS
jgi:hypothetical protein